MIYTSMYRFGTGNGSSYAEKSLKYLQNYKQEGNARLGKGNYHGNDEEALAFAKTGQQGYQGYCKRDLSKDGCCNCNGKGHHAKDCPKLDKNEKNQLGRNHVNIISSSEILDYAEGFANINMAHDDDDDDSVELDGSSYSGESGEDDESVSSDNSDSTADRSIIDGVGFIQIKRDRATFDPKKL